MNNQTTSDVPVQAYARCFPGATSVSRDHRRKIVASYVPSTMRMPLAATPVVVKTAKKRVNAPPSLTAEVIRTRFTAAVNKKTEMYELLKDVGYNARLTTEAREPLFAEIAECVRVHFVRKCETTVEINDAEANARNEVEHALVVIGVRPKPVHVNVRPAAPVRTVPAIARRMFQQAAHAPVRREEKLKVVETKSPLETARAAVRELSFELEIGVVVQDNQEPRDLTPEERTDLKQRLAAAESDLTAALAAETQRLADAKADRIRRAEASALKSKEVPRSDKATPAAPAKEKKGKKQKKGQ